MDCCSLSLSSIGSAFNCCLVCSIMAYMSDIEEMSDQEMSNHLESDTLSLPGRGEEDGSGGEKAQVLSIVALCVRSWPT